MTLTDQIASAHKYVETMLEPRFETLPVHIKMQHLVSLMTVLDGCIASAENLKSRI